MIFSVTKSQKSLKFRRGHTLVTWISMKLASFQIIKTYDKKCKGEMYEAYLINESFIFPVPSIHFVFTEFNTTYDIWNEKQPIWYCHLYFIIRNGV